MPDTQLYTTQAASAKAAAIITTLANSKLRLFKSTLVLTQFTTRAELLAAECNYDGYPEGGYELDEFTGPINDAGGGAVLTSPLVNPAYGEPSDPPVGNEVGGWWIEDSEEKVRVAGRYSPARPIQVPGDGFPVVVQIVEARNPVGL